MTDHTTTYPAAAINHPEWTPGEHWHRHKKRFSGKAVVAGIATALAVEVVLSLLGVALGLGSVSLSDPGAAPSSTTVTLAASMWAAVSVIASVFYGGFIAARLSNNTCHHMGILHGVVAWAGVVLVFALLTGSAIGGVSQIMGAHARGQLGYNGDALLNSPDRQNPNTPDVQARIAEAQARQKAAADKAAHDAAKTAAGAAVVLLLAGFVAGLGGSLGALHVKHHDRDEHRTDIKV